MLTSKSSLVSESYVAVHLHPPDHGGKAWNQKWSLDSWLSHAFLLDFLFLDVARVADDNGRSNLEVFSFFWTNIGTVEVSWFTRGTGSRVAMTKFHSRRSSPFYPVCHWDEGKWRKRIAREMRGKYPISKRPWLDWNQFSGDTLYSSVRHFFLYRVSFFRKSFLQFHETGETDIITLHSSPRV